MDKDMERDMASLRDELLTSLRRGVPGSTPLSMSGVSAG